MTLGEELDTLLENASTEQKARFENIYRETRENPLLPHDNAKNDRFWALIIFRRELRS